MTSVWLLVAIAWNVPFIGQTNIDVDTFAFESAARCLRNVPIVEEQLSKKYGSNIKIFCVEKELHPKDKKDE